MKARELCKFNDSWGLWMTNPHITACAVYCITATESRLPSVMTLILNKSDSVQWLESMTLKPITLIASRMHDSCIVGKQMNVNKQRAGYPISQEGNFALNPLWKEEVALLCRYPSLQHSWPEREVFSAWLPRFLKFRAKISANASLETDAMDSLCIELIPHLSNWWALICLKQRTFQIQIEYYQGID